MEYCQNILETIGNTPLVRLNKIAHGLAPLVLAKVEYFNPGQSVKDRMAYSILQDAEARGLIQPGGLIIEATSGNTGMGLALAAAARGYRCIFTISDKQSLEKINILRALGAQVIVCPADVPHEDERSYFSTAKRLAAEQPEAFFPFQYDNPANSQAHYEQTGPEIWTQTQGKVTHLVIGVGTGGTVDGISRYVKEQNPKVTVIGVEPEGSIFQPYKASGIADPSQVQAHYTEGIGSDFLPENVHIERIDQIVAVSDKNAAWTARALAKQEGLFVGWSSGAMAFAALSVAYNLSAEDVMVVLLPDHGSRYVQKVFNDDWMRSKGYWEDQWTLEIALKTARQQVN